LELVELAGQIVQQVQPRTERPWSLHPADGLNLSVAPLNGGMQLGYGSGWATLAGGLLAVAGGLETDGRVWASGAWNRNGLASIDGLEDKLALATEWGVRDFFVPSWQMEDAQRWVDQEAPGQLFIGRLVSPPDPDGRDSVRLALGRFLARLTQQPEAPPPDRLDEPETFETCRNYFLYQQAFSEPERAFYRSHLFPGVVARVRKKIEEAHSGACISHLATIVSPSHELAVLAALALRAKNCLLLYQCGDPEKDEEGNKMKGIALQCKRELNDYEVFCRIGRFRTGPAMWSDIGQEVEAFTVGAPPNQVAIDLTPGKKMMTYSLSRVARRGNWLFNLEARMLNDRRADPGTERPELWQTPEALWK
jgi:hypothetical protein